MLINKVASSIFERPKHQTHQEYVMVPIDYTNIILCKIIYFTQNFFVTL